MAHAGDKPNFPLVSNIIHIDRKYSCVLIALDIQSRDIHLRIEDSSILKSFELFELENPAPRKIYNDRVVYESRGLKKPAQFGRPILCDFGEARFGALLHTDMIQPSVYRSPEVILIMAWTYSTDIWNVGVMVCVS